MAKIIFKEEIELEIIESYDEDTDEQEGYFSTFKAGTICDVDIIIENEDSIDIQFGNGDCSFGIPKQYIEIQENES